MGFLDRISPKGNYDEEYAYEDEMLNEYADMEYAEETHGITQMHSVAQNDIVRIVTMWVSSYREIKDFAVEFRSGTPVILNLSQAPNTERARIVDFAVGLTFGLDGLISSISEDVFLLTPHSVKLDERGENAQSDFVR